MCPKDSEFVLITDANSVAQAEDLLKRHARACGVLDLAQLMPGVQMTEPRSLNAMLKSQVLAAHARNTC